MRFVFVALLVAFGTCVRTAEAGFVQFTDRPTWQAAAGPLSGTEDFNGFTTDAQFRTTTVSANNMTIAGSTGTNGTQTNKIDASPFEFSGFYAANGTSYLLGDLVNGATITFTFTTPVTAWGGDFRGIADGGRPTRMDVFDASDTLIGSIQFMSDATNQQDQFYGFTSTTSVDHLVIVNPGGANDAFGLDNIGFVTGATPVAAPEPTSLALLATAGMSLGASLLRRRRS
jgi:hypothetical protein